ncbi:EamA family transporter [Dermacoccus nishinomiyaensis]|uniref:EamA family transporter n=1 Tax=Dermacoccus nishinomiyaensis TaxID=1274 RepID=UPI0011A43928|nr:EamA family transporter [Dermacoccus nishinomiyaensis]
MVTFVALLSSAVWGTADFVGGLWAKRFHPVKVVALSQLGGLVAALIFFGVVSLAGTHGSSVWTSGATWGVGAGLSGAVGLMCLYAALSSGTMGVVSPITALGAIVPVVLGLVRGDSWTPSIGIGLLVALAGAVLASGPELSGDVGRRPVVLACISALGFGVSLYCMDGGARHDLSGAMLAMRCGSLTLLLPTLFALRSKGLAREPLTRRDVLVLPLLGIGDLTANLLFAAASAQGQVSIVAVLGSLYPVATLLLARVVLAERLRTVQLVGVALTVVGVVLVTV